MIVAQGSPRTLAVHPTSRGFGWVLCEGPLRLVEYGLFTPLRRNRRLASLREFERLLARFRPAELVLEAFDSERTNRTKRAHRLAMDFVGTAADRGLLIEAHSRSKINEAFADAGSQTREEIANAVARQFPGLSHRLPRKRKAWHGEDRRFALFNAAAVAIAHFHNGATALLGELRNAA